MTGVACSSNCNQKHGYDSATIHCNGCGAPWFSAYNTSSTRLEIPSFSRIRNCYFFTVCSLRPSSLATSRLLRPSATSATTCSWRKLRILSPLALNPRSHGTRQTESRSEFAYSGVAKISPRCTRSIHWQESAKEESARQNGPCAPKRNACTASSLTSVSIRQILGVCGCVRCQPAIHRFPKWNSRRFRT